MILRLRLHLRVGCRHCSPLGIDVIDEEYESWTAECKASSHLLNDIFIVIRTCFRYIVPIIWYFFGTGPIWPNWRGWRWGYRINRDQCRIQPFIKLPTLESNVTLHFLRCMSPSISSTTTILTTLLRAGWFIMRWNPSLDTAHQFKSMNSTLPAVYRRRRSRVSRTNES